MTCSIAPVPLVPSWHAAVSAAFATVRPIWTPASAASAAATAANVSSLLLRISPPLRVMCSANDHRRPRGPDGPRGGNGEVTTWRLPALETSGPRGPEEAPRLGARE